MALNPRNYRPPSKYFPQRLALENIWKLPLTRTLDPIRPTRRGILWKLALPWTLDPNRPGRTRRGILWKLALPWTLDPNRPGRTMRGIFLKLGLTRPPDPIWLGEQSWGGYIQEVIYAQHLIPRSDQVWSEGKEIWSWSSSAGSLWSNNAILVIDLRAFIFGFGVSNTRLNLLTKFPHSSLYWFFSGITGFVQCKLTFLLGLTSLVFSAALLPNDVTFG